MALSALRGAPLGCSCPALSRRLRPARPGRAVLAMASPKPQPGKPSAGEVLDNFFQLSRALAQRYDVLSAGAGALACTSFCVAQGQDPWTALSITAAATVSALVANELLFEKEL